MNPKIGFRLALIFGWMVFATAGFAQSSTKQINEAIKNIKSNLNKNPAQCKADLLLLVTKNPSAPDTCKAKIFSDVAIAFGMLNQLDSGLWAINQALTYETDKDYNRINTLRTKAILHRLKGEYAQATEAITASLQLNDSIWKNQPFKAIALQEYASLCNDQNKFYQATSLYLQALDVVNLPNNKDEKTLYNALKIQINLGEAYGRSGNYGFAIGTLQKTLPKLDSLKDYDGYIRAGCQMAEYLIQTNQCASADSLVNILLPLAREIKNEELESYLILKLGLSRSKQLKYQESLPYYRQSFGLMEKNQSFFILEVAIPYLTALKNTNDYPEARQVMKSEVVQSVLKSANNDDLLNYKKVAIHFLYNELSPAQLHAYYQEIQRLSDTVKSEGQKQLALELQAKYQFEQQEKNEKILLKENEILRESEGYKRKQIYLILIIATFLITTIVLIYLRLSQRSRIQTQELDVQKKENDIQKQQTEWALQEKQYRDQLLEQQKIVLSQTLADSEELKLKINQIVEEQQQERRKELMEQFEKAVEDRTGLDKLLVQFNSIHPGFASELLQNYPKLSQADMQFCILYRMNLSTKEISSLLHIEPRSIYAKKYRIMEKMSLGGDDDFDKIIFKAGV
jgi:tetratricopeptide (TPR) repeat protein/DNA-binding CsgD family transcriptional regulator